MEETVRAEVQRGKREKRQDDGTWDAQDSRFRFRLRRNPYGE